MPDLAPICVIFNPAAGRGQAKRVIQNAKKDVRADLILRPTQFVGHAVELARTAAEEGYPVIVAAGGDGTVHEVANGLLQATRSESAFSVWPIGSANDYAFTLGISTWWKGRRNEPLIVKEVDVGQVTAKGKSRYFVNGLGLGFNGAVTLESRKISWLRGVPLYGLATLKAIWRHFQQPRMKITFDEMIRENETLVLSVNLGQREGNFPVTPLASLEDGKFDVIHAGPLSRWEFIQHLPNMADGTLPTDHPRVWMGQCQRVHVESSVPVRIHVDGEFFCQPEEGISEVKIELLPRRLKVRTFPPGCWIPSRRGFNGDASGVSFQEIL